MRTDRRPLQMASSAAGGRGATLAARLSQRDRAAFVGRSRELRIADALFADDSPTSVLLVHGPGGIGKSVLLREIERRGLAAGWSPVRLDGRDLEPAPDALEEHLADAWALVRPLILIDGYERMSSLGPHLRSALLPSLPERTVVAVAGRQPPDDGWFERGWEAVAFGLALGPLSPRESRALLVKHGLRGDRRLTTIARWSGGWPLALRMAADAARADPRWLPGAVLEADAPAALDADSVREALRSLHVPAALAQSPLARGQGISQRAASVRELMIEAAEHAFGEWHDEQLLRRILVRGYVDPAPSHERAAAELHVSRSTYFRRLKAASERVAVYLSASGRAPGWGRGSGRALQVGVDGEMPVVERERDGGVRHGVLHADQVRGAVLASGQPA